MASPLNHRLIPRLTDNFLKQAICDRIKAVLFSNFYYARIRLSEKNLMKYGMQVVKRRNSAHGPENRMKIKIISQIIPNRT